MKKNLSDRNVLERNESQQIERFKTSKKFKNTEIQKSSGKLSDSKKKSKFKSLINENLLDYNFNSYNNDNDKNKLDKNNNINNNKVNKNYENGANKDNIKENDNSKMNNEKNIGDDSNNNNTKNNINNNVNKDEDYHEIKNDSNFKGKQNAFAQVDFWKEIVEEKIKNIILKYEEKEKEMKLKISDLLKNIQNIKSENFKLVLVLKTKLNEKNQEINNLKKLNDTLMKQLAKVKDNKNNLNNINNKLNNKTNSNESMNSNNNFISDYHNKNIFKQSDMINYNNRYKNDIIENDIKDMNIYQKRAPTFLINKSLNFQNKNKSYDVLKNAYRNNRYKVNKSKNNILRLKIERIEPNVFLKSISYCKSGDTLKKIPNDFSIKADNNIFTKKMKNKEKRLLSAKLLNIKDYSNVNKSQFRKTFFKLKLI